MTREQLEAVVNELVAVVDSWNDAQADDDRGKGNNAICLTLWDDGSGRIGVRRWDGKDGLTTEDMHDFADLDGLAKVLDDEGAEWG